MSMLASRQDVSHTMCLVAHVMPRRRAMLIGVNIYRGDFATRARD